MKGNIVVIEGSSDGVGKSTQCNLLSNHLREDNVDLAFHHFPSYKTYQAEAVSRYLAGEFGSIESLSPYFINSLYAHDRAITWHTYLKNLYEGGKTILLDRYTTSSLIYQTASIEDVNEKKNFIDYVVDFEYNKLGIKMPDEVIFLHVPFELATKMRNSRKNNDGISNDLHECNLEYMKKVYDNAVFVANYLSWQTIECSSNNQLKSCEEIHEDVYKLVKKKLY